MQELAMWQHFGNSCRRHRAAKGACRQIGARLMGAGLLAALLVAGGCTGSAVGPAHATVEEPETVVLLHGLGRGRGAMWWLADRLEEGGFRVVRVGYDSLDATTGEIQVDVAAQIDACCADARQPLHFVGHSLGGLVIRDYLARHRPPMLGRVVLIGTPNHGTPVVDHYRDRWWLQLIGETGLSLGTAADDYPRSLPPPDYPVGVIAGIDGDDGNDDVLPGRDDGLIPVESTKVAGMHDFIIIESSHSMMRYDHRVAQETIRFLKNGRFAP